MKKLIAVILALVFVLSLSACGAEEPASDLDYVKENGKLVVGITDFAPMDYEDENGEWIGFDADMAKEFAEYMPIKIVQLKQKRLNGGARNEAYLHLSDDVDYVYYIDSDDWLCDDRALEKINNKLQKREKIEKIG